jgi:DNA helicase IV
MQAREAEPQAATAPVGEGPADTSLGDPVPQLREILGPAEQTARGMLEAEEALRHLRQRFEQTEDPALQGDLAADALDHVERQMQLIRERRRQLDSTEAKLWARQNRIEGFLIHARGSAWWHARRNRARTETDDTEVPALTT